MKKKTASCQAQDKIKERMFVKLYRQTDRHWVKMKSCEWQG